jgi:hypothetical protein
MGHEEFQAASTTFSLGGLSPSRMLGVVLELPAFETSSAHEAEFALLSSTGGVEAELKGTLPIVFGLVLLVCIFRWAVMKWVITPTGNYWLPRASMPVVHRRKILTPEQQFARTLTRFENAGWEAIFYTFSSCFGVYVYLEAEWTVWPTTHFWVDWPLQSESELSRWYYLLALAFYTQALGSLLFFDKPRSDYWEYLLHHLVTIFLISVQ